MKYFNWYWHGCEAEYRAGRAVILDPYSIAPDILLRLRTHVEVDSWPDSVVMTFENSQIGYVVHDHVSTVVNGMKVVSRRLKEHLERHVDAGAAQFFPVCLASVNRSVVIEDYYVLNTVRKLDCIDRAKSNLGRPGYPVLKQSAIDESVRLFAVRDAIQLVVVAGDVADSMKDAGVTGLKFDKMRTTR